MRYTVERQVVVERGEDAIIQMVFCSKPQPVHTTWEWESYRIDAGHGKDRFQAERVT